MHFYSFCNFDSRLWFKFLDFHVFTLKYKFELPKRYFRVFFICALAKLSYIPFSFAFLSNNIKIIGKNIFQVYLLIFWKLYV